MLPFEAPTIFEQLPRFFFKMPKVVQDQKSKFESDELFRRISRESEVRYTGFRDRPLQERQIRFQNACREGHTELAFSTVGCNLSLIFNPCLTGYSDGGCDFEKETGKVHIRSHFIMNGVCVRFRGWLDLDRLDGVGCVEYDEERGSVEEALLKEQMERYSQRVREVEENQRLFKERQAAFEAELRKKHGPRHELSPERTSSASN
ncbi:Protein big brother [Halotydeus destructor]|nr:Protein big brother [Halotydeus destructor]